MKTVSAWFSGILLFAAPCLVRGQEADVISQGGDVITVNDKHPTAEAVAVANGKILAVGVKDEVLKHKGKETRLIDLGGKALLPGFIDGHGHCFGTGLQAASANLLAPQDYIVTDIPGVVAELKKYASTETAKKYGIILGFGYDDAQLNEQRHPTRQDLDAVSTEVPVYIIHQSGHLGAANTKALELAGITAETPDPVGGRDPPRIRWQDSRWCAGGDDSLYRIDQDHAKNG